MSVIKLKKDRIYIDTSVVGGYYDIEFEHETKLLFQRLENNEVRFIISDLMLLELEAAPSKVKRLISDLEESDIDFVELTDEAKLLGELYIKEGVVGKTSLNDCYHIAIATITNADVLASWNFKHIVNYDRIKAYNSINMKMGYNVLEIRNPRDLIDEG